MAESKIRFAGVESHRGPGAIELLDESLALLRRAPFSLLTIYLLGSLPFWLGVIYFVFDLTLSANAESRLPPEALELTVLYFWMKTCQAVFARKLLALVEGGDPEPWTLARWLRTALLQAIVAGSIPVVYPLAILATLPFAWVNAFYHNFSVIATDPESTLVGSFGESADLARLWPKQNHLMLGVLWLGGLVLLLNLAILLYSLPQLLNSLLGIETVFDENAAAWNNSSFYLALLTFCYLLLNPLNKAIFVLRCFYGRSRTTGADLRAQLRPHRLQVAEVGLVVVLFLLCLIPTVQADDSKQPSPAAAASAETAAGTPATTSSGANPNRLDQAIQRTLHQDEFAWRMPRADDATEKTGFLSGLVGRLSKYLDKLGHFFGKMIRKIVDWLLDHQSDPRGHASAGGGVFVFPWRLLIIVLAVGVLLALIGLILTRWRDLRREAISAGPALTPLRRIDLEDESVQADELPEDSWLALAQQLIERGDLQLALRAFYLATLAALARQELVRLKPAKSNRDYVAELTRRLRGQTTVIPCFRESVKLFEASWYGTHTVTEGVIESMRHNQRGMTSHVAR